MSATPSSKPTYEALEQQVVALASQVQQLQKAKPKSLIPSNVKIEQPATFKGVHDGIAVKNFLHACDSYFELVGIVDDNTRALFAQLRLEETARVWYDGQGYSSTTITWTQLKKDLLSYFVPVDQARRARKALMAVTQGKRHVQQYIDEFRKALLECIDVQEAEAKFVFESNLADWLAALVLPHNNQNLRDTVLCAQSIGSIERVHHMPQRQGAY